MSRYFLTCTFFRLEKISMERNFSHHLITLNETIPWCSIFWLFDPTLSPGSLEVRADGSFHEWTLENQSPGGSAKLGPGPLDLAVMGVRISAPSGTKTALLRTHPPEGYPGVQAMSYSGSYPVSKLRIEDGGFFGVQMDVYAYGTLHVRQSSASFVPAIMFTLDIKNPTAHSVNVSFLLNLPLGLQTGETSK